MRPLALLLLAFPAPALADTPAERLFYERTLMAAAGERCRLFAAPTASALKAGAAQARGAALRAGTQPALLKGAEGRARAKARTVACGSPDLATAAARVRDAFDGYSRMPRMRVHAWNADRMRAAGRWRLSQASGQVMLGLEGPGDRPTVTAPDGPTVPSAVRLRMRDVARDPHPDLRGGARRDRAPAAGASRLLWAASREPAPASLSPGGETAGQLWRLPAGTAAALAALDPREAVAVEFVYAGRGGETVRPTLFEVGDFAAGLAFLEAGVR